MLDLIAAAALFALLWLQSLGNPLPQTPLVFTAVWALAFATTLTFGRNTPPPPLPPPRKPAAIACALAGLTALLLPIPLLYPHIPPTTWCLTWGLGTALCTIAATLWRPTPTWRSQAIARLGVGMAIGTLMLWLPPLGGTYQHLPLYPPTPASITPVLGLIALLLTGIWVFGCDERKSKSLLLCAALLLLLRICGIHAWDIDPATRDMLALIDSATDALLAGKNPYRIYQMQPGSQIPLTYLPLLWGAHLAPKLLGLDIRWAGIAAEVALLAGIWWGTKDTLWQARALGFVAIWAVLPSVQWNLIYAEPMIWWALLVWGLATLVRGKTLASALLLGLMLCTRHFAVLLLPFFAITWARHLGWRQAAEALGLTGAVCTLILGPFILWDPEMFWFGTLRWLAAYGPVHHTWFYDKFSLAQPLYTSGWIRFAPLAQLLILLTGSLAYFLSQRRHPPTPKRLWLGALVLLGFIMFNGLIWYSFFLGTLLCALMTTAPTSPLNPVPTTTWRPFLLIASLTCGTAIAASLITYGHQPARDAIPPS